MWKNDCTKFAPNIFNKNKCANCYRIKEQHSDAALEVNKATRIVNKCGYLSVAPNWGNEAGDANGNGMAFSNASMCRVSKRWQRRWFVLYDDGELTYSVDDHPETVPQAIINMNNCFEVAEADSITGQEHSLAIVAPDGIHFVKASCREEAKMWLSILKLYPQTSLSQGRSTANGGRAKRSQTFPGMRSFGNPFPPSAVAATTTAASVSSPQKNGRLAPSDLYSDETDSVNRSNGRSSPIRCPTNPPTPPQSSPPPLEAPTTATSSYKSSANRSTSPTPTIATSSTSTTATTSSTPARKTSSASLILRSSVVEKVYNDKGYQYDRSSPSTTTSTATTTTATSSGGDFEPAKKRFSGAENLIGKKRSGASSSMSSIESYRRTTNPFREPQQEQEVLPPSTVSSSSTNNSSSSILSSMSTSSSNSLCRRTSTSSTSSSPPASECRGSPDGCGHQDLSTSPGIASTPEIMSKKGWLMKLGLTKEWHKYWFVLQDVALLYYRDPAAESMGFLDGIVDLGLVRRIEKRDLPRNFGFSVETYEGKTVIFSAITDGIRNSWITCLKKAAGLENQEDEPACSNEDTKYDYVGKSRSSLISGRSLSRSSFESDLPVITTARLVRSSTTVSSRSPSNGGRSINFSSDLDDVDDVNKQRDAVQTPSSTSSGSSSLSSTSSTTHQQSTASSSTTNVGSSSGDGILVDLLETEVDSLKAQLEKTQCDLVSLHHSNIDLESQLRHQQQSASSASQPTSKRYHVTSSAPPSSCASSLSSSSSVSSTSVSRCVITDPDEGEVLSKAKSTVAKQSAEILSLRNQLGMVQLQLKQRTENLQTAESSLTEMTTKLRSSEENAEKEADRMRREYERNLSQSEKEAEKWRMLYESTYLQYDRELHSWQDKLAQLEKERELSDSAFSEEERRKERIISDLSEQLKESEERIQELLVELDSYRERNEDLTYSNQETMCRLVVSMEEKFEKSLQHEKQQLELAFREKLKDAEMYGSAAGAVVAVGGGASRRSSLAKISTMSDLLSIEVPTLEAIQTMEREDMIEKFLILLDHFYRAIEEIRTLRVHLREAQDTNDQLELEKLRFEESFKRTIVMQEQQEALMSKRIQDLTNKLLVSEKTVKQLKERRHSRKSNAGVSSSTSSTPTTTSSTAAGTTPSK